MSSGDSFVRCRFPRERFALQAPNEIPEMFFSSLKGMGAFAEASFVLAHETTACAFHVPCRGDCIPCRLDCVEHVRRGEDFSKTLFQCFGVGGFWHEEVEVAHAQKVTFHVVGEVQQPTGLSVEVVEAVLDFLFQFSFCHFFQSHPAPSFFVVGHPDQGCCR